MTKGFTFSFLFVVATTLIAARPMDNFGVSHYTRLDVSARGVRVTYLLDLGEVPTFMLLKNWNLGASSPQDQLRARAAEQAQEWARGLEFRSAGKELRPDFISAEIQVQPESDGQSTARVATVWQLRGAESPVTFEDHNYSDRAGWKEIVIRGGEGVRLIQASQDGRDRSNALTVYAEVAPPQDLRASVEWVPGTSTGEPAKIVSIPQPPPVVAVSTTAPPAPEAPRNAGVLERLLERKRIPLNWMLIGLLAAVGIGGAHALTPGHGKTIVAAYLVGSRGTMKHAALLGGIVTFTHTISVFLLGLATLFLTIYVNQYKVTKALEAFSGLGIVAIGGWMLYQRLGGLVHDYQHRHGMHHHHSHDHGHDHEHSHMVEGEVNIHSLVALGVTGGLVPCPDALILLLFAISAGHTGAGLVLLVGFSAGLAAVLIAIGAMVLYAKQWLPDSASVGQHPAFKYVPVLSALVVVCLGLLMTGVSLGLVRPGLFG